jgi:hypothetical protein
LSLNFLIRALGFTGAGATLSIGIVAADERLMRAFPRGWTGRQFARIGPLHHFRLHAGAVRNVWAISNGTARDIRSSTD